MANDTRHAPSPQPALNQRYGAIGNTLRWIQDGQSHLEIMTDDDGQAWAVPGPVMSMLIARVEQAVAKRVTVDYAG